MSLRSRAMHGLCDLLRCVPHRLPGKTRLARHLVGQMAPAGPGVVPGPMETRFQVPSYLEPIAFHLLVHGTYEPDLVRLLELELSEGDVFVDGGANIGLFSLVAARLVGPTGRVLAVEPSPQVLPYLRANVASSALDRISVIPVALSDSPEAGGVDFYEAPPNSFGMGSMSPQFSSSPIEVRSQRLDEVLEEAGLRGDRVRVLKLDIEGAESQAILGSRGLLRSRRPPLVVMEACDWAERRAGRYPGEAQDLLTDAGYRLWTLPRYLSMGGPLRCPMTTGLHTIVARKSAEG